LIARVRSARACDLTPPTSSADSTRRSQVRGSSSSFALRAARSGSWLAALPCHQVPTDPRLLQRPKGVTPFRPASRGPLSPLVAHRHRALTHVRSAEDTARHGITSSARISTERGKVIPNVRAAVSLMISSNFVICSTGRSPADAPRNILSICAALRSEYSAILGP